MGAGAGGAVTAGAAVGAGAGGAVAAGAGAAVGAGAAGAAAVGAGAVAGFGAAAGWAGATVGAGAVAAFAPDSEFGGPASGKVRGSPGWSPSMFESVVWSATGTTMSSGSTKFGMTSTTTLGAVGGGAVFGAVVSGDEGASAGTAGWAVSGPIATTIAANDTAEAPAVASRVPEGVKALTKSPRELRAGVNVVSLTGGVSAVFSTWRAFNAVIRSAGVESVISTLLLYN